MGTTRIRVAGFCLIAIAALTAAGAAVDGYSISGSSAIETPTQTVSYDGQTYTIDAISRITAGESVTITTSVPSDATYNINLRGPDRQLFSSERKTGDATHTLSYFGPNNEAGTYAATIQDDGNTVAVYPIVIAGYTVSVPEPDSVEQGAEATISATVTERSVEKHSSLERVEVVVGNDDAEVTQSMARVDNDTYETTVSTDELAAETYNVYVVVRGNKTVLQGAEILGVSDTAELTVTEATTPTAEQTSTSGGETGGDDGGDTGGGETGGDDGGDTGSGETGGDDGGDNSGRTTTPDDQPPTPTDTATDTPRPDEPSTETDTAPDGVSATATDESPTSGGPGNVIAPSTQDGTATTGGSGPGFTASVALLAVLTTILIGRRR